MSCTLQIGNIKFTELRRIRGETKRRCDMFAQTVVASHLAELMARNVAQNIDALNALFGRLAIRGTMALWGSTAYAAQGVCFKAEGPLLAFDELDNGDVLHLTHRVSIVDAVYFARISDDNGDVHFEQDKDSFFGRPIAAGLCVGSLISGVFASNLDRPIYVDQAFKFSVPVDFGDLIQAEARVASKDIEARRVQFNCRWINQRGEIVIEGAATLFMPSRGARHKNWRA